jgi:hypothetical protein
LLPRLRSTRPARISFARTILATMLTLMLLSGVAPLSSLSRSRQCRMACCAGKSPHAEGSCSVAFATETQEEPLEGQVEEQAAHSQHSHQHAASATPEKIASSDHDAAEHHTAQPPSSGKKSSRALNVASQAMTTPCSPECAAAASASTQLPRPRDAGAMSAAGNPRPPTPVRFKKEFFIALSPSTERRRQFHPRAPPLSLINLSA